MHEDKSLCFVNINLFSNCISCLVKNFSDFTLHTYIYPTVLQVPTALLFRRSLDCIWSPVSFDVPPPFILPEKQEVNIMGCDEGKYSFLKRDGSRIAERGGWRSWGLHPGTLLCTTKFWNKNSKSWRNTR